MLYALLLIKSNYKWSGGVPHPVKMALKSSHLSQQSIRKHEGEKGAIKKWLIAYRFLNLVEYLH